MNEDRWTWSFGIDPIQMCGYWDNALTADHCREIIEIGKARMPEAGEVGSGAIDAEIRKAKAARIPVNADTRWIYERVGHIVEDLNNRYFGFELSGFMEPLQFTEYSEGDFHKNHIDCFYGGQVRKITVAIQLSSEEDYEGGDVNLHFADTPFNVSKDRGYAVVFPSYTLHEIKPVTKGTRYSLVGWATGKPFK